MKIFLSSTCYDLTDLRAEIEKFLKEKGHDLLLSDRATFPVKIGAHRHDVCIQNVEQADLFILVVDGRFGASYYKDTSISITWAEYRKALETGRRIIPFVRRDVFNERQTCRLNQKKGNVFEPFYADNVRVFDLIDEIQQHEGGYWIQPFDNSVEVKDRLGNLYETNHSLLNSGPVVTAFDSSNIPLSVVSGSTASYITKFITEEKPETLTEEIISRAIESLPERTSQYGEILGFEQIPGATDYYYFSPLRISGDEGEMIIGISPTALGSAVRKELQDIFQQIGKSKK